MNIKWQHLDLANIPAVAGVYTFKCGDKWLYIGESKNILVRLNSQHTAFQIALVLPGTSFLYCASKSHRRLEKHLIETLQPEWNGKTARGYKYPCCILPEKLEISPEQIAQAISIIGF